MPAPEADEEHGGANAEVLDAAVGALVGVAQLLLAGAQVIHLADDFGHHLLDAAQLRLDGLELLGGLDGRPVLGVGADVDVELDVAIGVGDCVARGQDVLEADVESAVLVGVEGVS